MIYYYKKWSKFLRKKTINFEFMLFILPPQREIQPIQSNFPPRNLFCCDYMLLIPRFFLLVWGFGLAFLGWMFVVFLNKLRTCQDMKGTKLYIYYIYVGFMWAGEVKEMKTRLQKPTLRKHSVFRIFQLTWKRQPGL